MSETLETLEELKDIHEGAPDGATDYSSRFNRLLFYKYNFLLGWFFWDGSCYVPLREGPSNKTRSLSDIKSIVELMEDNNKLRQTTIKEILNKKVSMTSTGREVWIRVQDVEGMLDE